jgi:polyisoprenoid-binding protein YceI
MKRFSLIIFLLVLYQTSIFAAIFSIDSTQQTEVNFLANSTFGDIEGITHKISGYVKWNGDDTLTTSDLYFEVPLNSIDTGIGLRNKHMREKYLETEKYSKAIYKGKLTAWNRDQTTPDKYLVSTEGVMSIHGVEKPISLSGYLTKNGKIYHAQYFFSLNIKDFNIGKPRFLLVSMDQIIHLKLDFYLMHE